MRRPLLSLLVLATLQIVAVAPAAAQRSWGDNSPHTTLCGHLNPQSPEGKQCAQVCDEQPAGDTCLVFLRFGPPGVAFIKQHDPKNTPDIPAAAAQASFSPEEATRLRWFLTDGMRWRDPQDPKQSGKQPTPEAFQRFMDSMDVLRAARDKDLQSQMEAANAFVRTADQTFGADAPELIDALSIASGFMIDGGMLKVAHMQFERLLKLTRRHLPPDHPEHLMSLTRYGAALIAQGKRAEGEQMMQEGLTGMLKLWGPYHVNYIYAVEFVWEAYMAVGEYARARLHAEDALRSNLRIHGFLHAKTRKSLLMLTEALVQLGDLSIADISISTVEMMLTGKHDKEDALPFLLAKGRFEQARAWDMERSGDLPSATVHVKAALKAFSSAYKLGEKVHGKATPVTPEVMMGLAALFARAEKDPALRLAKGLEAADVALKLRQVRLGPDHAQTLEVEALIARLTHIYGTPEQATAAYEALLKRLEAHAPDAKHMIGRSHRALALLRWGAGDLKAARAHALRSLQINGGELVRDTSRGLDDIQGQLRIAFTDQRTAMDEAVSLLASEPKTTPQVFDALLSWSGAITRAAITQRAAWRQRARLTPEQQQDHDLWRGALMRGADVLPASQAARARLEAAGIPVSDGAPPTLKDLCREVARRDTTLVQYVFYTHHERDAAANKVRAVHNRAMALLLDRRCKPVRVDLGKYEDIEPLILGYRAAVKLSEQCFAQKGKPALCQAQFMGQDSAGGALRSRIWDPIEAKLGKATQRLAVVPDGKLVQLAIDALPDGKKTGGYLVERYEMTLLPYTSALLQRPEAESREAQAAEAFVVGDVNYEQRAELAAAMGALSVCAEGRCEVFEPQPSPEALMVAMRGKARGGQPTCGRSAKWGRLATEAQAVAELLSAPFGRHVYLAQGDGATEPLVMQQLPSKRIIHLATHGFWDSARDCVRNIMRDDLGGVEEAFLTLSPPLRDITRMSAMVVAGANANHPDAGDDGFISGAEIAELDLSEAALVVLSACETGLGVDFIGEGALGLTRGFVLAGAHTVISALWQVPSTATADLFRDTYTAMTRKKDPLSPAAALRESKLAAIKRARAQGAASSALMWGAFVPLVVRER